MYSFKRHVSVALVSRFAGQPPSAAVYYQATAEQATALQNSDGSNKVRTQITTGVRRFVDTKLWILHSEVWINPTLCLLQGINLTLWLLQGINPTLCLLHGPSGSCDFIGDIHVAGVQPAINSRRQVHIEQ